MEQDKMLTIMGSPGSGKTTTAVKLARTLAARRRNVISGQYGGVDYMLPYIAELEQQDNEMALFEPMFSQESTVYQAEINRILLDVFDFQVTPARQTGKRMADVKRAAPNRPEAASMMGREKSRKGGFKVPFARNRGEF